MATVDVGQQHLVIGGRWVGARPDRDVPAALELAQRIEVQDSARHYRV